MEQTQSLNQIYRVLDVNVNRSKEGLRVVEEYFRFFKEDKEISSALKDIRYRVDQIFSSKKIEIALIGSRNVEQDVLAYDYTDQEKTRQDVTALVFANTKRVKESLRVLEEYSKLIDGDMGLYFQTLRFDFYKIEQTLFI